VIALKTQAALGVERVRAVIGKFRRVQRCVVPIDPWGQFYLPGSINGEPVLFLIDTGCSGNVSIGRSYAKRLGLTVPRDGWTSRYESCNGIGKSAGVILEQVTVAGLTWRNLHATILYGDTGSPLLGTGCLRFLHLAMSDGTVRLSW
jgi:aspartyl protease family protein